MMGVITRVLMVVCLGDLKGGVSACFLPPQGSKMRTGRCENPCWGPVWNSGIAALGPGSARHRLVQVLQGPLTAKDVQSK